MGTRAGGILAALTFVTSGISAAGDHFSVSIRVKQDGQMCEVLNQIADCTFLPEVLSQEFGADRNIPLSVSPEGCGEAAIGQIRVIINELKTAGYLQVSVAGNLSKPNYKCNSAPAIS
jgi:hypothetical protein